MLAMAISNANPALPEHYKGLKYAAPPSASPIRHEAVNAGLIHGCAAHAPTSVARKSISKSEIERTMPRTADLLIDKVGIHDWRNHIQFYMITIMSQMLADRLKFLPHREIAVAANEHVFRIGAPVRSLFLVQEGSVHLERHSFAGARLVLQKAEAGDILAEASCFATHYHCNGIAATPARLLSVPMKKFLAEFSSDPALAAAFTQHLAKEIQAVRARAEILSLKTVAARLDSWLELGGGRLPEKGEWHLLAGMLAVSPEALYRELARRRKLIAKQEEERIRPTA